MEYYWRFSLIFCLGTSVLLNSSESVIKKVEDDSRYSRIFASGQAYYYHLKIDDSGSGITATPYPFKGCVAGFTFGYEYKKPNNLYAVLQASYALGTIRIHDTGNNRRFIHDEILETDLAIIDH